MVSRAALISVVAAKAARSLGGLTAHRARARTSLTVTELGGSGGAVSSHGSRPRPSSSCRRGDRAGRGRRAPTGRACRRG
eukprot:1111267-Alexandrium_andersonii.AAC.1